MIKQIASKTQQTLTTNKQLKQTKTTVFIQGPRSKFSSGVGVGGGVT